MLELAVSFSQAIVFTCNRRQHNARVKTMSQELDQFTGRPLLFSFAKWEVYPIKGNCSLPAKFMWLDGLGDYFLYSTAVSAVTAIATRQASGALDGELVGHKGIRFVAKDFSDVIRQVELLEPGLFAE